jgi:diphthine synthase
LKLFGQCTDEPFDNSEKTEKISIQMMKKYVPMVREALEEIEPHYKDQKEFEVILENAELYINDAEKFLEDGQDEVAILSIGYADGLVDALRLAKGLEPKM